MSSQPPHANAPFALVLSGGSGTRFWPVSRNAHPKQLLNLFDDDTLLEKTLARIEGLVPKGNVLVLTNVEQEVAVRELLPHLPHENIIAEPAKRDTAPAIALATGWVKRRNPSSVMMVLPADQLVQDVAGFQSVIQDALAAAAHTPALVTIGIKPTWPCPSYGYIQRKGLASLPGLTTQTPIHEVERFREKPRPEVAEQFLEEGGFSWNAGMFIWAVNTVTEELRVHAPPLAAFIDDVAGTEPASLPDLLEEKFSTLPKISIDFALMEKAKRVLNLEAAFDWDDVGSWISVAKYLNADAGDNQAQAPLSAIDARHNIVYSAGGAHVALLGVDDLIVVHTEDALLIARRDRADQIKDLVDRVPRELQ